MNRRQAIVGIVLPLLAQSAPAQTTKVARIGFLAPAAPDGAFLPGFREGMRELGYIEGQTIHVEYRWAHGQFDHLPRLAEELVHPRVDVIVAIVTQASIAAQQATKEIPIVFVAVGDPVEAGLVASLAQPGGNATGTSGLSADVVGKQIELIREVDPKVSRIAALWNPANPVFQSLQVRQAEAAARAAGVELRLFEVGVASDFEQAFAAMRSESLNALMVLADPLFSLAYPELARLLVRDRVVAVTGAAEFVRAGGLMAYGPSYFHASKRAASYVDKILKGAKPADLPVELPTRFELVINLRTAKALGLSFPPSLLARADEVIE
jgi:putative ABC transport system substrate-binding protein